MFAFEDNSVWINAALFAVGAAAVWFAGTRLTRYADTIETRTRLGAALIGALLLGGITSLPEAATTTTAALSGDAVLAVNNVLGGVAMQVAVLALADAMIGKRGLSTVAGDSSLLLQGNGLMVALALAAAGIASGSIVLWGVDLWTVGVMVVVLLLFSSIQRYEDRPHWTPVEEASEGASPHVPELEEEPEPGPGAEMSNRGLAFGTIVAGLIVIAAGYLVTRTGDVIADQTGLGASFMGATFLAIATSLPEVSTSTEAVRRGRHRLAFSNIFGTNLLDVGFLFTADIFYREGSVLDEVGDFSLFAAMLGILLTGTYVAGILQREKRVIFRMGLDSAVVLVLYIAGAFVLYGLR